MKLKKKEKKIGKCFKSKIYCFALDRVSYKVNLKD